MMEHMNRSNLKIQPSVHMHRYTSMDVHYEDDLGLAWYCMKGTPRPCFTPQLLDETLHWLDDLRQNHILNHIKYIVVTSNSPGVFNLGGDLDLFCKLIRSNDREALMKSRRSTSLNYFAAILLKNFRAN